MQAAKAAARGAAATGRAIRGTPKLTLESVLSVLESTSTGLDAEQLRKLREPKGEVEKKWSQTQRRAMRFAAFIGVVFIGGLGMWKYWNYWSYWQKQKNERTKAVNTWRPQHRELERAWLSTDRVFPDGGTTGETVLSWINTSWLPKKETLMKKTAKELLADDDFGWWFYDQGLNMPIKQNNPYWIARMVNTLDVIVSTANNELSDVVQGIEQESSFLKNGRAVAVWGITVFYAGEAAALTTLGEIISWVNWVAGITYPIWILFWLGYAVGIASYHLFRGDPSEAMPQAVRAVMHNALQGGVQLIAAYSDELIPLHYLRKETEKKIMQGTVGRVAEYAIALGVVRYGGPIIAVGMKFVGL